MKKSTSTRPPSCGAEVKSTSGVPTFRSSSNVEDPELAPGAVNTSATSNDRAMYPSNEDDGVPGPYEYRRFSDTRGLRRFLKSAKAWGGPMIGV